MKVGDICVVKDTDRTTQHPAGTRVKVVLIAPGDDKPFYCQSEEGKSCYWYDGKDLEIVEREGLI